MPEFIFLFDGVCDLCGKAVQFTIHRDKRQKIKMAALQSDAGQRLLREFGLPEADFDTFVFIEKSIPYTKSTAALKYFRRLDGLWKALYIFIIIPPFIRDWVYSLVAKNRYRWFGKNDSCLVPTPDIRARFLE